MSNSKRQVERGSKSRSQINEERMPNRVRIGEARDLLSVENLDPNRYYRWVNDGNDGQDVYMMQRRGYRIETSKTLKVGDPNENEAAGEGSPHKKHVGIGKDGKSLSAYLMSIDREWYEEDQADLAAEVDSQERAILNPDFDDDDRAADYATSEHSVTTRTARARIRAK